MDNVSERRDQRLFPHPVQLVETDDHQYSAVRQQRAQRRDDFPRVLFPLLPNAVFKPIQSRPFPAGVGSGENGLKQTGMNAPASLPDKGRAARPAPTENAGEKRGDAQPRFRIPFVLPAGRHDFVGQIVELGDFLPRQGFCPPSLVDSSAR